jgi:hypothetical protein
MEHSMGTAKTILPASNASSRVEPPAASLNSSDTSVLKGTRIVGVTGDLILNTNLFAVPANPNLSSGPWPMPHREDMLGGSHYMFDLVRGCWSGEKGEVSPDVFLLGHSKLITEQAISVWQPFVKEIRNGAKEDVWRIANTLLATFPSSEDGGGFKRVEQRYKAYIGALVEQLSETYSDFESLADVIVIDDANLGYRDNRQAFTKIDPSVTEGCQIILKTRSPLYDSLLWEYLESDRRLKDRLTVVVSVESLRIEGIEVPRSKSWDEFLENLSTIMHTRAMSRLVGNSNRIVVSMPNSAIVVFKSGRLEHFIYHPTELEDHWLISHPGRTEGSTSIVTAAVCRSFIAGLDFRSFPDNGKRALAASRYSHLRGGGEVGSRNPNESWYAGRLSELVADAASKLAASVPEDFASIFQDGREGPVYQTDNSKARFESSILGHIIGANESEVLELAVEIVERGLEPEKKGIPHTKFGKYTAVDRGEVEKANQVAELIRNYGLNRQDQRPLSLAVFGQPGSGKSFSVEQIAGAIMADSKVLTYNLSQIQDLRELKHPFDEIRHVSVRGQIPLVFWDEFDTHEYSWLKSFLAPMQDAVFASDGQVYPFGKAIFVFAGGMTRSFSEFLDRHTEKDTNGSSFTEKARSEKIPDFVSRLRGYLDIKGVNPEIGKLDYLVRRAIILRTALEKLAPHLIGSAGDGMASIDQYVTRAFLTVPHYRHGARSIDALVGMSSLQTATRFGVEQLPSHEQMDLHTSTNLRLEAQEILTEDEKGQMFLPLLETKMRRGAAPRERRRR